MSATETYAPTEPMYDWERIRTNVLAMQADQGVLMAKMRDVLLRYDGDYVIPMIDVENEPKMPNMSAQFVGEAVDQLAMRASETRARVTTPPIVWNKETGKGSREYATTRANIIRATYDFSRWNLGLRRVYRHLTAYHTGSAVVTPDFKAEMPRIDARDPLCTYVEQQASESVRDPEFCAFVNRYSGRFLRDRFPQLRGEVGGPIATVQDTRLWEVVEWYDRECQVFGLLGPCDPYGAHISGTGLSRYSGEANGFGTSYAVSTAAGYGPTCELARYPNRLGFIPAMIPHNVSLGRIASRIGSLLGSVDLSSKLMALFVLAQEKSVFPDTYVIGENGKDPQITSNGGEWVDGRTGDVNTLRDTAQIGVLRQTADPNTGQILDRLERNFRVSTALIPQAGGETYGALRTGRGIDALGAMALDPKIQEMHEVMESYMPWLNKAILQTYKTYWGSKSYSLYCTYGSSRRLVEFTPETHIETLENSYSYRIPGADTMQLTQILGSLFGAGQISSRTFRENHPFIDDADAEEDQLREEKFEAAIMEALQQQIVAGVLPITVVADVAILLRSGKDIFTVAKEIDAKLRELQAAAPPPAPEGMAAAPETMPGMTGGPAADQMQPAVPEQIQAPVGTQNMRQVIQAFGAK